VEEVAGKERKDEEEGLKGKRVIRGGKGNKE
jgi:hypothetical protein